MSTDFNDRPFLAGTLTGIRSFNVDGLGRLSAVTRGFAWQPGENEATCLIDPFSRMVQTISGAFQVPTAVIHYGNGDSEKAHRAGQKGCSCGFYAYFDLGHNPHHQKGNVLGLIEGYGLMTVGDRGFRCEKARLVALVDESQRSGWWRRIVWRRVATDAAGVAWWLLMLAAFKQPGWARDLFGGMLGLQLGLSAFGWKRWLTRPIQSTVPVRVRELYPDVKIYPSVEAAAAAHPLVRPELPSPESDPEFWQRAS